MTACEQCGFVYEDHAATEIPGALRHVARLARDHLGRTLDVPGGLELLSRRPSPEVWSAIEYAGHLRDVFLTQRERFFQALIEDNPRFVPMHREERVVLGRYNDEDAATSGTEVTVAADLLARLMAAMNTSMWDKPCIYSYPEPLQVTLQWVGQHTLHEAVHHLGDLEQVLQGEAPSGVPRI